MSTTSERVWIDAPVTWVVGKGGVGRTSLAAAIACEHVESGHKTLLLSRTGAAEIAFAFGRPLPERGGDGTTSLEVSTRLHLQQLDERMALREALTRRLGLPRLVAEQVGERLLAPLLEAAPAVPEVALAAWIAGQVREGGGRFDRVVVDADASGHAEMWFGALARVRALGDTRVLQPLLDAAHEALLGPHSACVLVALPEPIAAAEALELHARLVQAGRTVQRLWINRVPPAAFDALLGDADQVASPTLSAGFITRARARRAHARALAQAVRTQAHGDARATVVWAVPDRPRPPEHPQAASARGLSRAWPWVRRAAVADAERFTEAAPLDRDHELLAQTDAVPAQGSSDAAQDSLQPTPAQREGSAPASTRKAARFGRPALVLGPGGVGKTTCSAAWALSRAWAGEQVEVTTVDPARRLATALGLRDLEHQAHAVATFAGGGSLHAAALDSGASFDAIVRECAGPADAQSLLSNPLYAELSRGMARAHAYAAVEAMHRALQSDGARVGIFDTPPDDMALELLDAPQRLLKFLRDGTMAKALKVGALAAPAALALQAGLKRVLGDGIAAQTLAFFAAFGVMRDRFIAVFERVEVALRAGAFELVVVTRPEPSVLRGTLRLLEALQARGVRVDAIVLNYAYDPQLEQARRRGEGWVEPELASADEAWDEAVTYAMDVAAAQRDALEHARALLRGVFDGRPPRWIELPITDTADPRAMLRELAVGLSGT